MSSSSWIRELTATCIELDPQATVHSTRKHVRIELSNGACVFVASTPSDHRALMNIRRDIRQALRKTCRWQVK